MRQAVHHPPGTAVRRFGLSPPALRHRLAWVVCVAITGEVRAQLVDAGQPEVVRRSALRSCETGE